MPDCSRCFGLCCVALPFTRSADFPVDKPAGTPCRNLLADHRCGIHDRLRQDGWSGCVRYDCFGAGQHVSQVLFAGVSWQDDPASAAAMFAVLPVVHRLHELLALLEEADRRCPQPPGPDDLVRTVLALADLPADALLAADLAPTLATVQAEVGARLREVSSRVRRRPPGSGRVPRRFAPGADLAGRDLRGVDLRAADLRGALLIGSDLRGADLRGADLLGTDLRDADLRGADLRDALFLTRPQLGGARSDATTRTSLEAPGAAT